MPPYLVRPFWFHQEAGKSMLTQGDFWIVQALGQQVF